MKRSQLLLFVLSFFVFDLIGQASDSKNKMEKREATQLISFEDNEVKRSNFTKTYHKELGLERAEDLVERKAIKGIMGWTRTRMQQRYQDLRVVGASYILHEKDGVIKKGSGDILPFISISTKPSLTEGTARDKAVQYTNTKILSLTDGAAVVLPEWDIDQVELVVMDQSYPAFSGAYVLAYHVIVSNLDGRNQYKESIYIDANTSKVIEAISEIAHSSVEGIANTLYYGEQTIIAEMEQENRFLLRDYTRGDGIITLNGSQNDFVDEDNYWDNYGDKEEVSGDAHYCASSYYDYMLDNFAWDGVDGDGFELKSRVYGSENNRVNATWNGSYATFYSGDCDEYGPLTTLDIVGHEFAHGFTDFTSDLIYSSESGALNESISDILGKSLEFTYDAENANWLIGSRNLLTEEDNHFRDMADPNTKSHPKLYAGEFWEFGSRDNYGVHINSGVFNYWFYCLVEGKVDTNELGIAYDVAQIGFDKATAIVFTMNTAYLTESSTYTKAVTASIESVKDLYGENSPEMASVLEAWKAVGLYSESGNYDLKIEMVEDRASVCSDALDGYEMEVFVINVGSNPYLIGDEVEFKYDMEDEFISLERVALVENLMPGDTLFYTFVEAPPLVDSGFNYDIIVYVEAFPATNPAMDNTELIMTNNSSEGRISTTNTAGLDIRVYAATLAALSACEVNEESQIRISIQNTGCSEIPQGDYPMILTAGGSEYNYDVTLPFNLRSQSYATIFDLIVLPVGIENGAEIEVELFITDDIDAENNSTEGQYLFLETVTDGYLETFSSFDVITNKNMFIDPDFRADAQIGEINGNSMLVVSGTSGTPFNLEKCGDESIFFRENYQKTDIELCVNTVDMIDPTFSFDLIMHRANELIEDIDQDYAVMLNVSIDASYGITYPLILNQEEGVSIRHDFELPVDFIDQILIEVMTLRGDGALIESEEFQDGDFALFDNLRLTSGPVSTASITTAEEVEVSPNPGNAHFYFNTSSTDKYDLFIYDGLGRLQTSIKDAVGKTVWDSHQAEEGIYFYDLVFKDGIRKSGKVVVSGK